MYVYKYLQSLDIYIPKRAPPKWAAWSNIFQRNKMPIVSKAINPFKPWNKDIADSK